MTTPLEDPDYEPTHMPVDGAPPEIIQKWAPASQLRWFARFHDQLIPQPNILWNNFYCESKDHRGLCCISCIEDCEYLKDVCCCRGL